MKLFLLLILELILLYALTRSINRSLYIFLFKLAKNRDIAIGLFSLLSLPGTIIHELAHLIMAEALRVPTGKISFTPKVAIDGTKHDIQIGSLEVAKVDLVRKYLVGLAPLFLGLAMLSLIIWTFGYIWPQTTSIYQQGGLVILAGYLLFSISNNMFSSAKDLEGFWMFAFVVGLFLIAFYLSGVQLVVTGQALEFTLKIVQNLTQTLAVVLGVNSLLVIFNRLLNK